jgi:phage gp29-like protein
MAATKAPKKAAPRTRKAASSSPAEPKAAPSNASLLKIVQPKVQDRWMGLTRRDWTPETVKQTLDGTNFQRLYQLFRLFELMEDTWPRLAKNLHDVRAAVCKLDYTFQPFTLKGKKASARAQEKAAFVEQALTGMVGNPLVGQNGWHQTIYDLMDAYGKGLAVLEVDWKRGADATLIPEGTRWLRPIHFDYPLYSGNADERLLLCPSGDLVQYEEFPDDHFIVGVYRTRSAVQATSGGILRRLAPLWVFSNLATEWLVNFAQLFGVPLRWGTYDPRYADQLRVICDMLENMGSAGWGAFPTGTELNLLDSTKGGMDNPQTAILERADKACDLLILGQTLTSDVGDSGSRALGDVHQKVRADRIVEAAEWVAETISHQLIPSLVRLNFGDTEELPFITPEIDEQKDALGMANRDKILFVDMKLPVSLQYLYQRHDVPEPTPNDELFEPSEPEPQPGFGGGAGRFAFGAKDGVVKAGQPCGDSHISDDKECKVGTNGYGYSEKTEAGSEVNFASKTVAEMSLGTLIIRTGTVKGDTHIGTVEIPNAGEWNVFVANPKSSMNGQVSLYLKQGKERIKLGRYSDRDKVRHAVSHAAEFILIEGSKFNIALKLTDSFGRVEASAHLDDVRLTDLPDDTVDTVRNFVQVTPRSRLTVPRYSMTVGELIHKADPHNLESARRKLAEMEPEKAAEEVRGRQDVKHILLMNDRVIDGHHFIAKAERGGYSAGLKVLDLTAARFQAKSGQELPEGVALALAKLPPERQAFFARKIHAAATSEA